MVTLFNKLLVKLLLDIVSKIGLQCDYEDGRFTETVTKTPSSLRSLVSFCLKSYHEETNMQSDVCEGKGLKNGNGAKECEDATAKGKDAKTKE